MATAEGVCWISQYLIRLSGGKILLYIATGLNPWIPEKSTPTPMSTKV